MKFRTKLIVGLSFVVFLISAILGVVCYQFNVRRVEEISRQNLKFYSRQLAASMDATVDSMKQVTDYILSDQNMLYAMQSLPKYTKIEDVTERKAQMEILNSGISIDYINRNFYRVIIFNESGDVVSSMNTGEMIINKDRDVSKIPWLTQAADLHGKILLVGPHEDGWSVRKSTHVFSLARKVQGGNFGYIEVQNNMESLEALLQVPDSSVQVAAWLSDGTSLYQSSELTESMEYPAESEDGVAQSVQIQGKTRTMTTATSGTYHIKVAVIQSSNGAVQDLKQYVLLSLALAFGCFAISMIVVIMIVNKLSRPITILREQMEHTGIENLDEEPLLLEADDEMVALGKSYQRLLNRLNESMIKEKRLSLLQLQAQFDTLQAQVNPHFLYNVLNVISNRGIIDGDEEICEICGSLAAMLRYSTSNRERYATVKEELEYLKKYIFLLKSRYEHRLEVELECEEGIKQEIMPKIVLQQLVENSIQHGFITSMSVMKIRVRGWQDETGWYFEVWDNGQGITKEVLDELNKKINLIKEKILMRRSNVEMEIGGMGLANTYARMFLLYADQTVFEIKNTEEGVSVIIGTTRRGENYVPDHDRR